MRKMLKSTFMGIASACALTLSFPVIAQQISGSVTIEIQVVGDPPVEVTLSEAPGPIEGTVGQPFSYDFSTLATVSGGRISDPATVSDLVWTVGAGSDPLPAWLSLNGSTGAVSGTPDVTGSASFEMVGSYLDGEGRRIYTISVNGVALNITDIDLGDRFSCALTAAGGVKCWGQGTSGQLGNGSISNSNLPVDVTGLTSGVASISAGGSHACAVTSSGGAKCWGNGSLGRLGNSSSSNSSVPVDVFGLTSGVASISAGGSHTCAVLTTGGARCWGNGADGRLGNGDTTGSRDRPQSVSLYGTNGIQSISSGGSHTCAVTTWGSGVCWGDNFYGQLGNNTTTDARNPVNVNTITSDVTNIYAGGFFSCSLRTGGETRCWGQGSSGQIGDFNMTQRNTPTLVSGLSTGVASIDLGTSHACAILDTGELRCWGDNGNNQLGDGSTFDNSFPSTVTGLSSGVVAVSGGNFHTCAMTSSDVLCWGRGAEGQLGNGLTGNNTTPGPVTIE